MFNPRVIRNLLLKVGDDVFSKEVNDCNWSNTGNQVVEWQGGTPEAKYSDVSPSSHVMNLVGAQDWDEEESLCVFLHEHEGEQVDVTYRPRNAVGAAEWTATVTIVAPSTIGGPVAGFPTFTVAMPSDKPVRGIAATV